MKLTDERKVVVVLLITGSIILVVTQIMINDYGQVRTHITTRPGTWPWWKPLEYSSWRCPSDLIRFQEIGVAALASGITLMIRARVNLKR